jgi:thiamine phosphate synthase YjbQ (UPF0047 family)
MFRTLDLEEDMLEVLDQLEFLPEEGYRVMTTHEKDESDEGFKHLKEAIMKKEKTLILRLTDEQRETTKYE